MTLSEIIKEMQGRQPVLLVEAFKEALKLAAHAEGRLYDLHDRVVALEMAQQKTAEKRKPGRPRKSPEVNLG